MKQFKKIKWIFVLSVLFLFSCSKDNESGNLLEGQNENFVGSLLAKEIGSEIYFRSNKNNSYSGKSTISKKKIENVNEVKNDRGVTVFYVINYFEGGFVILSADNRTQPIIGFSEDNKFVLDDGKDQSYPLELRSWMENEKKYISKIQTSQLEQTKEQKNIWKQVRNMLISNGNGVSTTNKKDILAIADIPNPECYEHTESRSQGPFLQTKWWQYDGFNDALRYISCTDGNKHVFAGCVPIAMAQVMKYYQYPSTYNWSAMPKDYATSTTANFILDIHNAINNVSPGEPSYSCNGTGVSMSTDLSLVLKNKFKYASAQKANYNYQVLKAELDAGRPVILEGFNKNTLAGHMWVCDGHYIMTSFFEDCRSVTSYCLSMNWGWRNGENNGFYSYNNFNPGGTNYNEGVKMTYNIKP
ncbi:MAG: hypothetical protein EOO44_18285 [Flavobacterium sp.]|nr:MAG: hypothetical protein EOO44_18285 [Flavobacterium sp.]